MSGNTAIFQEFWSRVGQAGDGRYAPATAQAVVVVTSVERDASGALVTATGTIDGDGSFTVPMKGHAAAVGDHLLVGYPANQPVGAELAYLRHVASDYPGAGLVIVDATLPAPTNLVISSVVISGPGLITAEAVVTFTAVENRYQPIGYTISFRVNGGNWADRTVPHLGGTQQCNLGRDFPPGATLDVHARARYAWSGSESVPTADVSATLALDNVSPGSVTTLDVDTTVPNTLRIAVTATVNPDLLRGYRYELNTAPTGAAAITSNQPGPQWDAVVGPGTYYVAVTPISKSGTLGGRLPTTGFAGPYTVNDYSALLDLTPPDAMGAPTLYTWRWQDADNAWHGYMTVARPAYSEPSDFAATEYSIICDDGRAFYMETPATVTSLTIEVGFGTFTVSLRGRDLAGNRPIWGPTTDATINRPTLSNVAPTVGTTTVGAGIKVSWNRIDGALSYEVQRATDNLGTGAATVATVDALWYFDPLISATIILPTYYYRVRALSVQDGGIVTGTYSTWVAGTAGAIDAQNLRLASITAGLLAADAVVANNIAAGAVTAAKLTADLIMTTKIRTATAGTRWELEGHTGSGTQDQFRAYEAIGGVDKLRMLLTGAGLTLYNDSAQAEGQFYRDSTGHAHFTLGLTPAGVRGAIETKWNSTLGRYVAEMDTYYANMIWRQSTGTVRAYADQTIAGGYTDSLVFEADNGSGNAVLAIKHATDGGYLFLRPSEIVFYNSGTWYNLGVGSAGLESTQPVYAPKFRAGIYGTQKLISWYNSAPISSWADGVLGYTAGATNTLQAWQYNTDNTASLRLMGYRGATVANGWSDSRFLFYSDVDNGGFVGGSLQLGARGFAPFWSLGSGTSSDIYRDDTNNRISTAKNLFVGGALSKTSGSFVIPDPTPGHERDELRHCFVEGPTRGENLYTYVVSFGPRGGSLSVQDSEGAAVAGASITRDPGATRWVVTVPLPDYWPHLNERPRCLAVNSGDGWGRVKARVNAARDTLTVEAEEGGEYTVLLLGTRTDPAARDWWDRRGVRKNARQQWDNGATLARRRASLQERAHRARVRAHQASPTPTDPPSAETVGAAMWAAQQEG